MSLLLHSVGQNMSMDKPRFEGRENMDRDEEMATLMHLTTEFKKERWKR